MFRVSLGIPSRFAPAARSPLNRPQTLDRIARKGAQVPTRPVERGSVRLGATDGQGKMYVPSDSFGGLSPERKASNALRTLFTFVAVRVVGP